MPNAKAVAAKEKKAAAAAEKAEKEAAIREQQEAAEWSKGAKGKSKKQEKTETAAEKKAKKEERDKLLAEEEASLPSKKAPPKKAGNKGGASRNVPSFEDSLSNSVPTYSAHNIEDAIDALDIANSKDDAATVGSRAAKGVDTHPERRFKGALEAYKEKRLPALKKEQPGLRLQQYENVMYKEFQKHPDNPFNQTTIKYNASKEDKVAKMTEKRDATARRLQDN